MSKTQPYEVRVGKGDLSNGPIVVPVDRVPGTIVPPRWFNKDELECWNRTTEILAMRGQLSKDSYWSVVAMCQCWAEWLELMLDIRENGRIQGEGGLSGRQRPEVAMFQIADKRLRGWLQEFGLTDASRGKVSKPDIPTSASEPTRGSVPSASDYGLPN